MPLTTAKMSHYWSSASGNYPAWWQVDFKSDRRILYFGVSGLCWEESSPSPGGTWYLEGSPSGSSGSWVELWHGGPEDWGSPVYLTQSSMQSG